MEAKDFKFVCLNWCI